ncbi:MAG: hypothetical protein LBQ31_10335 [Bacteroidales bacterium]|jgi:hypothetical protein|nr:hypothetical protein [Bacteroidales bacterium]
MDASDNPTPGNIARVLIQGASVGTAFIPVWGWIPSLTLAGFDFWFGEDFYKWLDSFQ